MLRDIYMKMVPITQFLTQKSRLVSSHYGNQGNILGEVKSDANGHFKISYHNALSNSWGYHVFCFEH
jgi:hypothetical protein